MTIRHTSAAAYEQVVAKAETDRDIIAQLVRQRGPMTRRQIATVLCMETSSVSGRVTWLAHPDQVRGYQMGFAV